MLHNRVLQLLLMGRIIILRIFKDPQRETGNPCGVEGEEAGVAEAGARAEFYSTEGSKMYIETDDGYSTQKDLDKSKELISI